MVCSQYLLNLLFLSLNLLSECSDLLQYICFLNLTTPVEVMAKIYVILDHPSYTKGVKKKIKHYFVCIKVKQARVLQPDQRSSEDCNTLLHEGFANEGFGKECNIAFVLYVPC